MNMHRQLYNVPAPRHPGRYQEPITSPPIVPTIDTENPVNCKQAQKELGIGKNMVVAIRKAMGIKSRYFFLSDVRRFIRQNPEFKLRDVYPHWTARKGRLKTLSQSHTTVSTTERRSVV